MLNNSDSVSWSKTIFASPFLWGAVLTIGFYASIPYIPEYRSLFERYFCNHPLEYATTFLFMVGVAFLCIKGCSYACSGSLLKSI
ncbi:MAG: hypothetical protein R3C11_19785 [Planctomycetaceae bacterium]